MLVPPVIDIVPFVAVSEPAPEYVVSGSTEMLVPDTGAPRLTELVADVSRTVLDVELIGAADDVVNSVREVTATDVAALTGLVSASVVEVEVIDTDDVALDISSETETLVPESVIAPGAVRASAIVTEPPLETSER